MWHHRQRAHISLQLKFLIKAYLPKLYEIIYGIKISHGNITERIYFDLFYDFVSTSDYTYMVSDDWEGVWNDSDVIQSRKTTEIPVKVSDVNPAAYIIEV